MTTLIKTSSITYIPGKPGFPGKPAIPGTPERTITSTAETPGSWGTSTTYAGSGYNSMSASDPWYAYFKTKPVWYPPYSTTSTYTIPAKPGVPAVPPVPATPSTSVTDLNIGWNSNAKSKERVGTGQFAGFRFAPSSVGIVAGLYEDLYNVATIDSYKNLPYAFYVSRGKAQVMLNGTAVGPLYSFVDTDEFAIQYDRGAITFMQNDVLLKTVTLNPASDSLLFSIFSVMYVAGDTVLDTRISSAVTVPATMTSTINVLAFGRQGTKTGNQINFPALTTSITTPSNVAVVSLSPFRSRNSDHKYAEAIVKLQPITTSTNGDLSLGVATSSVQMFPFNSMNYGTTGTIGSADLSMQHLRSKNSDHPMGEAANSLQLLRSFGVSYTGLTYAVMTSGVGTLHASGRQGIAVPGARASMTAPAPTIKFFTGLSLDKSLPSITLMAQGTIGSVSKANMFAPVPVLMAAGSISGMVHANLMLPGYSLLANGSVSSVGKAELTTSFSAVGYTGASAKLLAPVYAINAVGSVQNMARAMLVAPSPVLVASGQVSSVGKAALTLTGKVTLKSSTGWRAAALTFSGGYTLNSTGIQDSLAHARLTAPQMTLLADAITETVARADLLLPMIRSSAPTTAVLTIPTYQIRFTASGDIALEYEAYSLTLSHAIDTPIQSTEVSIDAMTRYTRYPFTQIVRLGSSYYGAAADGLYLLEGDTDNGLPIEWDFELTQNDFQQANLKRIVSAVVGGRIPPLTNFTLKIGERADESYSYNNAHDATVQNYRQRFGRGVRARYLSVGMNCAQGSDFEIDTLSMEVETLSRKTHG